MLRSISILSYTRFKKSAKDYYSLLVTDEAQSPDIIHKWKSDFNFSVDHLREYFLFYLILLLSQMYSTQIIIQNWLQNRRCTYFLWDRTRTFAPSPLPIPLLKATLKRVWILLVPFIKSTGSFVVLGILSKPCPSNKLLNEEKNKEDYFEKTWIFSPGQKSNQYVDRLNT